MPHKRSSSRRLSHQGDPVSLEDMKKKGKKAGQRRRGNKSPASKDAQPPKPREDEDSDVESIASAPARLGKKRQSSVLTTPSKSGKNKQLRSDIKEEGNPTRKAKKSQPKNSNDESGFEDAYMDDEVVMRVSKKKKGADEQAKTPVSKSNAKSKKQKAPTPPESSEEEEEFESSDEQDFMEGDDSSSEGEQDDEFLGSDEASEDEDEFAGEFAVEDSDEEGDGDSNEMESDDASEEGSEEDSDDNSDDEDDEFLEGSDAENMGDEDLAINTKGSKRTFRLPSGEEIEQEASMPPNLAMTQQRIHEVLFVLANFKERREQDKSRQEYVDLLVRDMCQYYGYIPFLIKLFLKIFSPHECLDFLEANEKPRPITLRTNTLRTRRKDLLAALQSRGVSCQPIDQWTKVGIVVYDSKVPVGATPEYMAGHYMLQSASSFLPCIALAPQPGDKVLDMAAAPGGKAAYLAALMRNQGSVVANDANDKRVKSLSANMQRLGVTCGVVTCIDGRLMPTLSTTFDRVLLDAPCSGLGVIAKDPSVRYQKDESDIHKCSALQKELILAAIDVLDVKNGKAGYLVYSTCTLTVEENEAVVQYALDHRDVKVVESGLTFGEEGFTSYRNYRFHPSVKHSRRYYPHTHNLDGFFVCKLRKISNSRKNGAAAADQGQEDESDKPVAEKQQQKATTAGKNEKKVGKQGRKYDVKIIPAPSDKAKQAPKESSSKPGPKASEAQAEGGSKKRNAKKSDAAASSSPFVKGSVDWTSGSDSPFASTGIAGSDSPCSSAASKGSKSLASSSSKTPKSRSKTNGAPSSAKSKSTSKRRA